ncbi:MAG TPA: hypothetical protein PLV45_00045 [bacterium]|nr:hypothetical protein [bacterium]
MNRWISVIILVVAGIVFCAQIIHWWPFTHDDAWISFRYAENFVKGHGLVFNPGERVEGYTNFLWTILMAGPIALDLDPVPVSKFLGILLSLCTLVTVFRFSQRFLHGSDIDRNRKNLTAAYAVLILTVYAPFSVWAVGGLETPLFAWLIILGIYLAEQERSRPAPRLSSASMILITAALTRPGGIMIWAILLFFQWKQVSSHRLQRMRAWLLPFATVYIPWFAWRWWYYGWLLPNTYYLRQGSDADQSMEVARNGMAYIGAFLVTHGGLLAIALLLGGSAVIKFRTKSRFITLLVFWSLHLIHAGGDEKPFGRLIVPMLPLIAVILAKTADEILHLQPSWRGRFRHLHRATALLIMLLLPGAIAGGMTHPDDNAYVDGHIFKYCTRGVQLGKWIHAHARPGESMAARAIGALGYYSKIPCYDLLGVTDEYIAHLPLQPGKRTAHGKSDLMYILSRNPTYITFMLMEPTRLGYRRKTVELDDGGRMLLFVRDPALAPDPEYLQNPKENQGLLLPFTPETTP